jgi:hypothetical protein
MGIVVSCAHEELATGLHRRATIYYGNYWTELEKLAFRGGSLNLKYEVMSFASYVVKISFRLGFVMSLSLCSKLGTPIHEAANQHINNLNHGQISD